MSASGPTPPAGTSSSGPEPATHGEAGSRRSFAQVLKDIGLFFAAPFVTLAYVALFPFLAVAELREARRQRKQAG